MAALSRAVINEPGKAYYYFYYDGIDSALHHYGPGSAQVKETFREFLKGLEWAFWENIRMTGRGKLHNTAFILTADHGQTTIDPARTIYLNMAFPEIEKYLRRNRQGRILAPAGSCRDMFLYIRDECLEDAFALLQDKLNGRAVVCRTDYLIKCGYFGKRDISEAFRRRLGNIIILPLDGESVWWYEKGVFEVDFKGHHGGLTKDEMEIPFLMWAL
jgi:predicted AlkP superfamily pyrophosphatase or phosphodiesterase